MKEKLLQGWYWEAFCLLLYLALAVSQLFVKPIIGVAPNGDFPKVLGPLGICDPDRERDIYAYVTPRYIIDPNCFYDPRVPSSETLVARINKLGAEWKDRKSIGIIGAGKV